MFVFYRARVFRCHRVCVLPCLCSCVSTLPCKVDASHSACVPPCVYSTCSCLAMFMFNRVCVPLCLSFVLSVRYCQFVPQCLCSQVSMFRSVSVPVSVLRVYVQCSHAPRSKRSIVCMFQSFHIPPYPFSRCLCSTKSVFCCVHVPQHQCISGHFSPYLFHRDHTSPNLRFTVFIFHHVYVSQCPRSITSTFHSVHIPPDLCFTMSMFHHIYVPQCSYSTRSMFHSVHVSPHLPFTVFIFRHTYVSQCLCSTISTFHGVHIPPYLCFTVATFHHIFVLRRKCSKLFVYHRVHVPP